jgi:hypothetical protein
VTPLRFPTARDVETRCPVSVIIKAHNHERDICAVIESSLCAVAESGGEVILADGHSTDRTVEFASRYPIRIVQLVHPQEHCRGVTPQLGYQHSRGDYLLLVDGDTPLAPGFLEHAIAFLAQHPEAAGVGGRSPRAGGFPVPAKVDKLQGAGLYRRLAIEESGYFSNRNLHSLEDFDLAVRLRALGWKLWRIPIEASIAKAAEAGQTLRANTGQAYGLGELLHAAAGQPQLKLVWRGARDLRIHLAVLAWWLVLAGAVCWPLALTARLEAVAALAAFPWLVVAGYRRSLLKATLSLGSWWLGTVSLLHGVMRPQKPPRDPIASRVLQEPPQAPAPRREHYA